MGKNGASRASLVCAFTAFFLCGGILAVPGVIVDKLLGAWGWNMTHFGFGIFLQGVSALLGTRTTAWYLNSSIETSALRNSSKRKQRSMLPACAGLSAAGGIALLYFFNIPWIGFALLGWAVGAFTVLGNVTALGLGSGARMLTIINMAFTAGAVALPAATALILAGQGAYTTPGWLSSLAQDPSGAWKLAPAIAIVAFLSLCEPSTRYLVRKIKIEPENPAAIEEEKKTESQSTGKTALRCASIALVCYVGTEINLSNNWMPFLGSAMGSNESVIRLANPLYWFGLLAARVIFSFAHPAQDKILSWLRKLGYSSLIIIGAAIAAALLQASPLASAISNLRLFISPWFVLVPCFLSGLAIGVSYSFILGAVVHSPAPGLRKQLEEHSESGGANGAHHAVTATMHWGVLGAIALPPVMGIVAEYLGYIASMAFVFLTQVVFTGAIVIWQRLYTRR